MKTSLALKPHIILKPSLTTYWLVTSRKLNNLCKRRITTVATYCLLALISTPLISDPQRRGPKPTSSYFPNSFACWLQIRADNGRHWQETGRGKEQRSHFSFCFWWDGQQIQPWFQWLPTQVGRLLWQRSKLGQSRNGLEK